MSSSKRTVITITHSDGVGEAMFPSNRKKPNPVPSTYDYFHEVEKDSEKHINYRIKLCEFIIEVFAPGKSRDDYILEDLPTGYVLFDHRKFTDGKLTRNDTYLFGSPAGKKYRSPKEFREHILFLAAKDFPDSEVAPRYETCNCGVCVVGGSRVGTGSSKKTSASKRTPGRKPTTTMRVAAEVEGRIDAIKEEIDIDKADETFRLGERQSPGWAFRKGEVVWIWLGDFEDFNNDTYLSLSGTNWAAGLVVKKPIEIPAQPSAIMWQPTERDEDKYSIQLLTGDKNRQGEVVTGLPQVAVRPWLSRPHHILEELENAGEHESIKHARVVANTFSFFGRESDRSSDPDKCSCLGVYIGGEKIFIKEPIRIRNTRGGPEDDEEVMVVDKITLERVESKLDPESNGKTKKTIVAIFTGKIYTTVTGPGNRFVTGTEFSALPPRMRTNSDSSNRPIRWHMVENAPREISMKNVYGRYYEPMVIAQWMSGYDPECNFGRKVVKEWAANRKVSLKISKFNDVCLLDPEDLMEPYKSELAIPGDEMDIDDTPSKGFAAVNSKPSQLGSGSKSKMMMAVANDENDDVEEFADDENKVSDENDDVDNDATDKEAGDEEPADNEGPEPDFLHKSPTKRMSLR